MRVRDTRMSVIDAEFELLPRPYDTGDDSSELEDRGAILQCCSKSNPCCRLYFRCFPGFQVHRTANAKLNKTNKRLVISNFNNANKQRLVETNLEIEVAMAVVGFVLHFIIIRYPYPMPHADFLAITAVTKTILSKLSIEEV